MHGRDNDLETPNCERRIIVRIGPEACYLGEESPSKSSTQHFAAGLEPQLLYKYRHPLLAPDGSLFSSDEAEEEIVVEEFGKGYLVVATSIQPSLRTPRQQSPTVPWLCESTRW